MEISWFRKVSSKKDLLMSLMLYAYDILLYMFQTNQAFIAKF